MSQLSASPLDESKYLLLDTCVVAPYYAPSTATRQKKLPERIRSLVDALRHDAARTWRLLIPNFCIAETCIDETIYCFDNLECLALIDCVSFCGDDEACIDECGVAFENGVTEFVDLITCVSDGCPGECGLYK